MFVETMTLFQTMPLVPCPSHRLFVHAGCMIAHNMMLCLGRGDPRKVCKVSASRGLIVPAYGQKAFEVGK